MVCMYNSRLDWDILGAGARTLKLASLGLSPDSATYYLCDLWKVSEPPYFFISSSMKEG